MAEIGFQHRQKQATVVVKRGVASYRSGFGFDPDGWVLLGGSGAGRLRRIQRRTDGGPNFVGALAAECIRAARFGEGHDINQRQIAAIFRNPNFLLVRTSLQRSEPARDPGRPDHVEELVVDAIGARSGGDWLDWRREFVRAESDVSQRLRKVRFTQESKYSKPIIYANPERLPKSNGAMRIHS
jgi:hypothetical protein